jgi:hypothetical protein
MPVKKISRAGNFCFLIMGAIMIVCASLGAGSGWWLVGFSDCSGIDDQYFFITLKEGLCLQTSAGDGPDFDDCTSWDDLTDASDDSASSDAQAYIDAEGVNGTALAISLIFAILCFIRLFLGERLEFLQWAQAIVVAVAAIFFVASFGMTGNTYYTNTDNYGFLPDICSTTLSASYAGYGGAVVGFILGVVGVFCVLFPCCCCAEPPKNTENQEALNAGSTANPVANSTASPVTYAVAKA